jgi:HEAT repeat protein
VPSRSAAYGLAEIGAGAVPGLLDILAAGTGSRARKLAAFALGEIAGTGTDVADALCRATQDPAATVRINATEGTRPEARDANSGRCVVARDQGPRSPGALLGRAAEAAVPALRDALHDENRYVPGYAVEALERIVTPDAMQVLLPFLKTARWCAPAPSRRLWRGSTWPIWSRRNTRTSSSSFRPRRSGLLDQAAGTGRGP